MPSFLGASTRHQCLLKGVQCSWKIRLSQGLSTWALDVLIKKSSSSDFLLPLYSRRKTEFWLPLIRQKLCLQQELQLLQCFKLGRMHTEIANVE